MHASSSSLFSAYSRTASTGSNLVIESRRGSLHHGQRHRARVGAAKPHALRRLLVVARLREHDVLDIGLRIAIVEREQARLDLHHDPVTRQEHVIDIGKLPAIALHLPGLERRRLAEALKVAPAKNLDAD